MPAQALHILIGGRGDSAQEHRCRRFWLHTRWPCTGRVFIACGALVVVPAAVFKNNIKNISLMWESTHEYQNNKKSETPNEGFFKNDILSTSVTFFKRHFNCKKKLLNDFPTITWYSPLHFSKQKKIELAVLTSPIEKYAPQNWESLPPKKSSKPPPTSWFPTVCF